MLRLLHTDHCGYPFPRLFFFNDTATTEIYTLSLHDALPISHDGVLRFPLPAHLLVWLGDVDDVLNAGKPFQARGVDPSVVPDQADRGALRPRHRPGLVPHLLDHRDDAPDLRLGRAVTHHDQHRYFPPMVNRSPSRAAVTRPVNRVPAARAGSEVSTGG